MTVAELKRQMTVGRRLSLIHCLMGPVFPNKGRTVAKLQGNGVWFACDERADNRLSWLSWPKSAALRETSDGFQIIENGEIAARYRWLD